jgi:hypothetical protein
MPRPDSELDDLGAIADLPAQAAYRSESAIWPTQRMDTSAQPRIPRWVADYEWRC